MIFFLNIVYAQSYTIYEATQKQLIKISANGRDTYSELNVVIENLTETKLSLDVNAGLYFINPDTSKQNLITFNALGSVTLEPYSSFDRDIRSVCTDAGLGIPSNDRNWEYNLNYSGGLDEAIAFYSKYQSTINTYLMKKYPEHLGDEKKIQAFSQVVIWAYTKGDYSRMVYLLKKTFFRSNPNLVDEWLSAIYKEAKEIAQLIEDQDLDSIKKLLNDWYNEEGKETLNEAKEKGSESLDKVKQWGGW